MKIINSKALTIPLELTRDIKLQPIDVFIYCKIQACFDNHTTIKQYPVELLCLDCGIEPEQFTSSSLRLASRGFLSYEKDRGVIKLADYTNIFEKKSKHKSLYLGKFQNGICKVGITTSPKMREQQLSQYGMVFTMTRVYSFEQGGLAEHLEKILKSNIPMMRLQIPGGTECFEGEHYDMAVQIIERFISSVFCGEVTIVNKDSEMGSM